MIDRRLLLLLSLLGCSSPPVVSIVLIRDDATPELDQLSRLRLIVRTCDSNQPALANNIPLDGTPPPTVEGPVLPGTSFYIWLQGWEACNPPCVPENEAGPNDCTCVGEDTAQVFKHEACTDWKETDSDIRFTLTLAPKASPPLCPPAPLAPDDCKTP